MAYINEHIVLTFYLIQKKSVVVLSHQQSFQFLNGVALRVLDAEVVLQIVIHQAHLLEELENHLRQIILFVNNMKRFGELLFQVLTLVPLHLQDVEGDFAHLDGAELGRVGVRHLAGEPTRILLVILLLGDHLGGIVLVELRVHIIKVNLLDVELVDILIYWVARCDSDISMQLETWVGLVRYALLPASLLAVTLDAVLDRELALEHPELDIYLTAVECVDQAVIVGGGCTRKY